MTVSRPGVHAGHPGRYKDCQHDDCRAYRAQYTKRWSYERSKGIKRLTDAEPARLHIATLRGAGWSLRSIAGAADLSVTTISKLVNGQPTVKVTILDKLRGVTADMVPSKTSTQTSDLFVPRVGTTRRIQALLFMGWTHNEIHARSGIYSHAVLHQQGRWVTRATHDKIASAYDQLSMVPGPSVRTRTRARSRGYVGPLSWDDIDLDLEPCTMPADYVEESPWAKEVREREERKAQDVDEVAVRRRLAGDQTVKLTKAERRAVVAAAHSDGLNDQDIAAVTGIPDDTVMKDRHHLGLPALVEPPPKREAS